MHVPYTWSTKTLNGVKLASSAWASTRLQAGLLIVLTAWFGSSSEEKVLPSVSPLRPLLGGVVGRTSVSILNLTILLDASENVPHLDDLMFHQMFVKRVRDLQSIDEHDGSDVIIVVIIWL